MADKLDLDAIKESCEPFIWKTTDGRPLADADGTHPNDDDFFCVWRGLMGRAEQMDEAAWYYGVYLDGVSNDDGGILHHFMDDDVLPKTRDAALLVCEALMRRRFSERDVPALIAAVEERDRRIAELEKERDFFQRGMIEGDKDRCEKIDELDGVRKQLEAEFEASEVLREIIGFGFPNLTMHDIREQQTIRSSRYLPDMPTQMWGRYRSLCRRILAALGEEAPTP